MLLHVLCFSEIHFLQSFKQQDSAEAPAHTYSP